MDVDEQYIQSKKILKWSLDGEPYSIDMAMIIELLSKGTLTQCVLACDANKKSSEILFNLKEH